MKVFRQPWFLILVAVVMVYTYQFYNMDSIQIGTTQAQATENAEESATKETEIIEVKISENFEPRSVESLSFATYLPMKVKMNSAESKNIIVSLIGEGSHYKNDGEKLSDWFEVSVRSKTLEIKSPEKKEFKGLSTMKELAKKISGDEDRNLTLIIEFPTDHNFKTLEFNSVSADLYANDLRFKKMNVANVSGDLKVKKSAGEEITVETVSGDSDFEIQTLKKGHFTSVSGDTLLKASLQNPEIDFESVSGDFTLEIPSESQVDVNFNSMTGELVNDFGVSKGKANKIKFSSLSGDAKISKIK